MNPVITVSTHVPSFGTTESLGDLVLIYLTCQSAEIYAPSLVTAWLQDTRTFSGYNPIATSSQ